MSTVRVRHGRDRGAADALGLVLLAPASIGLALLVVGFGRRVDSVAQARTAAEAAAQAAALERDPESARRAARAVSTAMLFDADSCAEPSVEVDVSQFEPGGWVAVSVLCHASNRGIEPIHGSSLAYSARAVAGIDPYRSGGDVDA